MAPPSCPLPAEWQEVLEGRFPGLAPGDCSRHLADCRVCQAVLEDLTGGGQGWPAIAAELRQQTPPLPPAYWQALEMVAPPHETQSNQGSFTMPARIHIERMPHRVSMAVAGESVVSYVLLKLIPSGLNGTPRPLGLNLALALDISGSMYEEDGTGCSRLQRVQNAASAAIAKLRPQDTLAIVGFAHNARLLLPPTPVAEKGKIDDVLRRVDMFDVDPGGTAMDEGMALALEAVEKQAGPGKLSQLVVLTDGETSGEQNCRALARQAAARQVRLSLMGVGLDWKASLIKDLAQLGQGAWHYIDVNQAEDADRIFAREFETLAAAAFLDVQLLLRPMKDVQLKRLRQVVPEIRELPLEAGERGQTARLGTLQNDVSSRYILDLVLPRRPDGKYVVAHLEATYDPGAGRRESTGETPIEIAYTSAGNGYVNAEVMKYIDEIQLKEMSDILSEKLQANDTGAARQIAQQLAKKCTMLGPRGAKKTMLVQRVLDELNATGRASKKTQIALDDEARIADLPS